MGRQPGCGVESQLCHSLLRKGLNGSELRFVHLQTGIRSNV